MRDDLLKDKMYKLMGRNHHTLYLTAENPGKGAFEYLKSVGFKDSCMRILPRAANQQPNVIRIKILSTGKVYGIHFEEI